MDPVTQAIKRFQEQFRECVTAPDCSVIRVAVRPKDARIVAQVLRAEEWAEENNRPYLIVDTAFTRASDAFDAMCGAVREHYQVLRKALAEEGKLLPIWSCAYAEERPKDSFHEHLAHFADNTAGDLGPPVFCWLPTDVQDDEGFVKGVTTLVSQCEPRGIAIVVSDDPDQERLNLPLQDLDGVAMIPFEVDEAGLRDYFDKMMQSPSGGHTPGTLPGAAAPDVEPPQRPGPKPPTDEEVARALEAAGLPPALTASQGIELQRLVYGAAVAAGNGDETEAMEQQINACALCAEVGLKLEQSVLTTVLASYLIQFQREEEAKDRYIEAAALGEESGAWVQVAQARLGLAYLYFKNQMWDEAAQTYLDAADAADAGDTALLSLEGRRMAGRCLIHLGRERETIDCWMSAVEKAVSLSGDEIRNSSFLETAGELIKLLDRHGLEQERHEVEALIGAAGEVRNA